MSTRAQRWVATLRQAIKQEHGFGWNVREISGKVQLTRRYEDQSRSSVVLDIPWNSDSITPVLAAMHDLRTRMEQQQIGLKEAYLLGRSSVTTRSSSVDWVVVIDRFRKHKVDDTGEVKASTFNSMYQPVMNQILKVVQSKPRPRDAKTLLGALRDQYGGPPGSRARQLRIQYAVQLLKFSVTELGTPERWMPPVDLKPFAGKASQRLGKGSAVPIKDDQLLEIVSSLPDERWQDAIKLLACFGLRPVELKYLSVRGDRLHVSYIKRTSRGSTSAGDVHGLDPLGMEGESARLIDRLSSHHLILPPLGSSISDVAQSVNQYLNRRQVWVQLKDLLLSKGETLSSYSFRHGYALRAHERYGLSPRVTAALMRHSLQTHVQHYGHWTDALTIDQAIERATRALVSNPL